ncbi:putative membrane protein [Rhodopirellula maiorica SM1]|uniref:Putative membrane protein n=1 Tax=Rhodopirellula maiorica SM1 TaxID=1265738 RepID=M5RT81_9BACT|nr:DUF6798 domain-containing protein [Rhodopirellula maiorica]EMI17174.1 putative membrane protein [Rhodopirellula maiorica SM1]
MPDDDESASQETAVAGQTIDASRSRWWPVLEVIAVVALFFIYAADAPPMVNEAHYLVKAKNFWQPDWCANDLFTASGKAHTTFYFVFGWPTLFLSLEATAWIGRFVGWTLIAIGLYRLTTALISRRFATLGVAVAWIAAIEYGNLAGEWVIGGIEAKVPAYGLVLMALAELVHRRWNRVWILLGIASAFHVLSGGWSVVAVAIAWLFCEWPRPREDRKPFFTPALFLGGAIALIGVVPALWLTMAGETVDSVRVARIYTFYRLPHHLLPSNFQFHWYVRHAVLLAGCITLAWITRHQGHSEASNRDGWNRFRAFAVGAILIAVIGLILGGLKVYAPDMAAKLLRYYWFRLSDAVVALWFALLLVRCVAQRRQSKAMQISGFAGLAICLVLVGISSFDRIRLAVPPSASNAMLGWDVDASPAKQQQVFEDWLKVCDWVRLATDRDEVFLTPRHQQSFKWYAERAEVVNWKDVPQDSKSLDQWYKRFREIFPPRLSTIRVTIHYASLIEYRKKYGVNYIVVDRRITGKHMPLVRIYPLEEHENDTYAVYELPYAMP